MTPVGFVLLTIEYHQEKDHWTARCPQLGTSMFGDSFEEAQEAIIEAIQLHLSGLEEVGKRKRFFKEHDIKFYRVKPSSRQTITVPVAENTAYQPLIQPVCV